MRHNSLVSLITKLLVSAGFRGVVTEPLLLPRAGVTLPPGSNPADNARADVSARSIWNPMEGAFLDVRVYHAQAPSNRNLKTIPRMYSHQETCLQCPDTVSGERSFHATSLLNIWCYGRGGETLLQEGCSKDGQ